MKVSSYLRSNFDTVIKAVVFVFNNLLNPPSHWWIKVFQEY